MAASFQVISPVYLDDGLKQRVVAQAAASFGKTPIPQMERQRDDAQLALLHALATVASHHGEPQS